MRGRASFSLVMSLILIGYGVFCAILKNSFYDYFILSHLTLGAICFFYWLIIGGFKHTKNSEKFSLMSRKVKGTMHISLDLFCVITLLVIINFLANRHNEQIDTTEENVHSLIQESLNVVRNLRAPVHLTAVLELNNKVERDATEELFALYQQANREFVSYEIIDPKINPYRVEKELKLKPNEHLSVEYKVGEETRYAHATGANEEIITNAIIKLVRGEKRKLYYVIGHGEPRPDSEGVRDVRIIAEEIYALGYKLEPLVLAEHAEVPSDAVGVILIAPQKPLMDEEKKTLKNYLLQGGGAVFVSDPEAGADIKELVADFGIDVGKNIILDQQQKFQGAADWQVVAREYARHPITKYLENGDFTVFFMASTVGVMPPDKRRPKATYVDLIQDSSKSAWAETDLDLLLQPKPQAMIEPGKDILPPFALAVAYEEPISDEKTTRMVVFGDSNWIRNADVNLFANRKVFLSALDWVTEENNTISIPSRKLRQNNQLIWSNAFNDLVNVGMLLPEVLLMLGLMICWRRKRH